MGMLRNVAGRMKETAAGLARGTGIVMAAPLLLPGVKPVAKTVIKGGLLVGDRAKKLANRTEEEWHTLVEEARDELKPRSQHDGEKTSAGTSPYGEWTVDELYEKAQELDIHGRGDMNKKELIRAIQTHTST